MRSILVILSFAAVGEVGAQSVGAGSGPLSEISRPLAEESGPVHGGGSVTDGSVGSMTSGPVRGQRRVGVRSRPAGAVTVGSSTTDDGSSSESAGDAIEPDLDPVFGEQVYDIPGALAPLQQQLRLQAQAAAADEDEGDTEPVEAGESD